MTCVLFQPQHTEVRLLSMALNTQLQPTALGLCVCVCVCACVRAFVRSFVRSFLDW